MKPIIKKNFSISLLPVSSFGETNVGPIIDVWKQVGYILNRRPFTIPSAGTLEISLEVSNVIDLLEACRSVDEINDTTRYDAYIKSWLETGTMASFGLSIVGVKKSFESEIFIKSAITAIIQELYISLNLCAAGAGRFNSARCIELNNVPNIS